MQCANFIKLEREQRGLGHAAGAKSLEESCPRAESYPRAALDVGPILGQDLCTCVFPALIMRMVLRQLRKLVEVDVNDLPDRWRDAGLCHDHQLVWGEPDDRCDSPISLFMRQNHLSGKVWQLNLRRC